MIHHTVAVVTAISPGCVQPHHHLVPPSVLAQMLGEACQTAFGQPLQLLHHLLSLVHGVKTVHPKHNFHLHLQGQHVAKRLVFGVDESLVFHVDRQGMNVASPLCSTLFICSLDQSPTRARTLFHRRKKVYPWGVPPRVSSRVQSPHAMSLHQSAPLVDSLNHVAPSVWAHSTLISCSGQDGELFAVDFAVLRTNRDPV